MNSNQIKNILQNNRFSKIIFKGVYPSNNIPSFNEYPYCLIANTDRYGEPGTHWVAIYAKNNYNVEYFDSFGEEPNKDISLYLQQFKHIDKNKSRIQSIYDNSCGAHVIYYIIKKCQGKSLKNILSDLNSPFNDSLVKLFVYNLIKL
jgi:hypothetical protein